MLWAAWREDRPRLMWPVTARALVSHCSGDLGVRQARVIPEHQGFALRGWKGVKCCHEGLRGGDGWLPGLGQAGGWAGQGGLHGGTCPDDHFPQQVGQGLIAGPQVPPSAVHGGEGGLGYFFCRGNVADQESGQPGQGAVVRVIEHGNRLVSVPSGHGWRPGHPGAGRVRSVAAAGRAASVPAARYPWPGGSEQPVQATRTVRRRALSAGCAAAGLSWRNRVMTAGTRRVAAGPCTISLEEGLAGERTAGGCPWPAGGIRFTREPSAGDRSVSLTGRLDQLAQRGGYLPAARGRELPEDPRQLLLPPRRGLADQMLPVAVSSRVTTLR